MTYFKNQKNLYANVSIWHKNLTMFKLPNYFTSLPCNDAKETLGGKLHFTWCLCNISLSTNRMQQTNHKGVLDIAFLNGCKCSFSNNDTTRCILHCRVPEQHTITQFSHSHLITLVRLITIPRITSYLFYSSGTYEGKVTDWLTAKFNSYCITCDMTTKQHNVYLSHCYSIAWDRL